MIHVFRRLLQLLVLFCFASPLQAQQAAPFPFDMLAPGVNIVNSASSAEKTREFYGVCLGLKEIDPLDIPGSGPMIRYMGGKTEIKFIVIDKPLEKRPGGIDAGRGIRMMTVFVGDADGVVARLKEHGYDVARFFGEDGKRLPSGYVRDADDNEVNVVFLPEGMDPAKNEHFQFGLTVGDPAASRAFYGKLLGLKELEPVSGGVDVMHFGFQAGPTTIRFMNENKDLPAFTGEHTKAFGMHYIQFVVQDVDALHEKLKAKGATIAREPFDLGTLARIMFVSDPDGLIVEFAGPLPKK